MRSPHSNNTQLVDVGKQEESDDSDCYIEEDFDRDPQTLPREMQSLDPIKASSHLTDSYKHGQSQLSVRNEVASVDEQADYGRSDSPEEVHTSGSGLSPDMHRHSLAQYGPARDVSHSHRETNLKLGIEERHFSKVPSNSTPLSYESRKVVGYPVGVVSRSPEVVDVGSEPQSPEIIEEESEGVVEEEEEEEEEESQPLYSELAQNESAPKRISTDEITTQSPLLMDEEVEECKQEGPGGSPVMPQSPDDNSKFTDSEVSNTCNSPGSNHVNKKDDAFVHEEENHSPKVTEVHIPSEVSPVTKISNDKYINSNAETNGKSPKPVQDSLVLSNQVRETEVSPDQNIDDRHLESLTEHISDDDYVKDNENRSKQVSVTNKDSECSETRRELPDQSDSEQVVTSSGMDEDVDDSHQMDESCDSSASDKGELDTSQEGETDHEVTLGESFRSDTDISCTRDEVEEADSSLSEFDKSHSKMDASISENEASESNSNMKVASETVIESALKQKNVPKRKREPSQKRSKKLKVTKKQDSSKEPADDSDELPDLLKSTTPDDKKIKVGDLVWVKYRKDWWPSYIKNVYPRDKKFSIVFVACDQNSGIRVYSKNVKKLHIWDVPSYVNQHQEGFSSALHLCKLFQQILEQGNEISAHDFFSRSPQAQVALLNQKKSSKSKASSETKKQKPKAQGAYETPKSTPKKLLFDDPNYESVMSSREKNKLQSALKARKADNQKLVKFMKSHECIERLWKIYKEEIPSERHNKFKDEESRKSLLWMGIGPFQLDDGDEQIMSVINVFKKEILSKDPQVSNASDYVIRVWIPEAIKEALRVVKKVPESELDDALYKGYRETAIEKRARQLSF